MTFVANTGDQAACLTKGERYDLDTIAASEDAYEHAAKLVDQVHVAGTLKGQRGKGGGGIGPEETLISSYSGHGEDEADIANTLKVPSHGASWQGGSSDTFIVEEEIAPTVRSHPRPGSNSDGLLIAAPLSHGSNPNSNAAGRRREDDFNLVTDEPAYTLNAKPGYRDGDADTNYVTSFHMLQDPISDEDVTPAWGKGNKQGTASIGVAAGASVRRLTPTECERLQSLPDGWTQLGDTPDSRRYAALGDAVTASVGFWIGRRLIEADA